MSLELYKKNEKIKSLQFELMQEKLTGPLLLVL
jgi:hypothetical protein